MNSGDKTIYKQNTLKRYVRVYFWSGLALILCTALILAALFSPKPLWESVGNTYKSPSGYEMLVLLAYGIYSAIRAVALLRHGMWVTEQSFYVPTVEQTRALSFLSTFAGEAASPLRFDDLSTRLYGEFHLDIAPYTFEAWEIAQTRTGLRLYFNDSTCVISGVNGSNDAERAFLRAFVTRAAALRPDLTISPRLAAYRGETAAAQA